MKLVIALLGIATAAIVFHYGNDTTARLRVIAKQSHTALSPEYKWTQMAPPGSGTHQYEWKPGTYPSAVVPLKAVNDELWMIGRNKSWSSRDGVKWKDHDKHDWGERISTSCAFFNNTFWVSGGMQYATNTFLNEIWFSKDGEKWEVAASNAEWSPRKNHSLVAFKDRLWLFGGETSVDEYKIPNEFTNDVWQSTDGIHWTRVLSNAPWKVRAVPQVIVFKGKLWLVGGQGHSDIWNSDDGKVWSQVAPQSPWKNRYDYGVAVLDDLLWVYGGREADARKAYNDVWFSPNGVNWVQQTAEAPWSRRSGGFSVVFHGKLFLYGGKHTGHADSFSGDIWTLERN